MQKQRAHLDSQYCVDKTGKRLTTTNTNGYSQQPLVIPGWSNVGGLVNQEGHHDTSGLVRDWRPDHLAAAYSSSSSQVLLEGLTSMDFGMPQQRYFNPLRPDLNLSSSSSSSASSLTVPKTTGNKSRPSTSSRGSKKADKPVSEWRGPNGPNVVERFVWGGKYECEKLLNGEFICLACGKSKTSRPLLVTHLNYHRLLESKRFSCTICDKVFSRQREVERHEKTHLTKGR